MSMLANVTRGAIKRPSYVLMYGVDGVGKSTWASKFPKAIFLGPENGTDQLDEVVRFPAVKLYTDAIKGVRELTNDPHDFSTLVIDTMDWLETVIQDQVAMDHDVKTVGDIPFGRGFDVSKKYQDEFRKMLEALREKRKMNIVLLAHADVENFTDPTKEQDTYQRYIVKMHKKSAALWREAVDCVLFATHHVIKEKDKQDKKSRFKDGNRRVAFTERGPGYDAKNRFGLPHMIDLNDDFLEMIKPKARVTADELLKKIEALHPLVLDQDLAEKALQAVVNAGNDVTRLSVIANRYEEIVRNQGDEA